MTQQCTETATQLHIRQASSLSQRPTRICFRQEPCRRPSLGCHHCKQTKQEADRERHATRGHTAPANRELHTAACSDRAPSDSSQTVDFDRASTIVMNARSTPLFARTKVLHVQAGKRHGTRQHQGKRLTYRLAALKDIAVTARLLGKIYSCRKPCVVSSVRPLPELNTTVF
jgi:hypothetical protein